nr:MAG TPA: Small Terminase [Caudoviricetes sp.]
MKTKSPEREKARKLYLKSNKTAKNKEIAEKLGVSASLVAKWKSQDKWDSEDLPKEKVKSKGKNKSKGKPGAPFGNHNAFAKTSGAPPGNSYGLKHGGYSQVYWDTIDEAEREMIQNMPKDEETMLLDQIKLFSVRERRIMQAIEKVKGKDEQLTNTTVKTEVRMDNDSNETEDESPKPYTLVTSTENKHNVVARLEDELTRVQRAKSQAIATLSKLNIEKQKIALIKEKDDVEIEDTSETDAVIYGENISSE